MTFDPAASAQNVMDNFSYSCQSGADEALIDMNLDHLALTPTMSANMTNEVVDNTVLARMLAGGDTSTFAPGTMSLKDILTDTSELQTLFKSGGTADAATMASNVTTLVSAATWQRHARVANDCVGTVWYVAVSANGGDDANDGLTPWTPKLTPKTVIEAATAGDLVLIGPGTFALGNNGIVEPDGVVVCGSGMDVTVLTSTKNTTAAIFKPGTNGGLSDLTIHGINTDWTYQRPLGLATGQSPYTNAVGKRLHIIAYSDGYYATGDSATSMYLEDCWIEAKYDCINCYSANQALTIRNSILTAIGPFGSSPDLNYARAIVADNGGIVRAYNCQLRAQDGGNIAGVAVAYCGLSSSKIEMYNCDLIGSNVTQSGPVYSLRTTSSAGSLLLVSGCEYDRTATTGTGITDIPSHSVDSNGLTIQAAANAALAAYNTTGVAKEASVGAIATILAGITSLAKWLGLLAGKTADTATLAEVNATTAGATFSNTTDSLEAIRDRGDASWITGNTTSPLDAQSTRDAMKLAPTTGDPATGSVDKHLDDIITQTTASAIRGDLGMASANLDAQLLPLASISLGTGARTVTITVTDGTDALESARVRVTSGLTSQVGDTNASGVIVFGIDDATWSVTITKSDYSFTPTTLVVAADTSHTYAMTAVTIHASDPTFVTGYLYCYDENGEVEESVTVQMKIVSLSGSGSGYDTATRSETSDATGLVTFTNLVPGALYSIRRGTETDWVDITISAAATDPYEMDNLFGEDS